MARLDRWVGEALGKKAGLPRWMGGGTLATAPIFAPIDAGGWGVESMVALRRRVVVETTLIGLNRAILGGVDQSPADQQWLHAWGEQIVEEGGEEAWRAERVDGTLHGKARADGERRHKDHMSACKDILEGVGMRIRDARPWAARRGSRRRWRDASIAAMLRAAPPVLLLGAEEAALATAQDVLKARDVYVKSWARATGGGALLERAAPTRRQDTAALGGRQSPVP